MAVKSARKSRKPTGMYAKGVKRREKILSAAAEMIEDQDVGEFSLKEIANRAGVSSGTAYHFYANATEVLVALSERFMESLREVVSAPYEGPATESWQALIETAIDRGIKVYRECPSYQKLILGVKTPPEIKLADRANDQHVGLAVIEIISRHFQLPEFPNRASVFFYATEIADTMYTLSVVRDGHISDDLVEEAKIACIAYLRHYLPESLPPSHPEDVP